MIEFTIVRGIALISALLGVGLFVNGVRCAFVDEIVEGGALLAVAWWLL